MVQVTRNQKAQSFNTLRVSSKSRRAKMETKAESPEMLCYVPIQNNNAEALYMEGLPEHVRLELEQLFARRQAESKGFDVQGLLQDITNLKAELSEEDRFAIQREWIARARGEWTLPVSPEHALRDMVSLSMSLRPKYLPSIQAWGAALHAFQDMPHAPWMAVWALGQLRTCKRRRSISLLVDVLACFGRRLVAPIQTFSLNNSNRAMLLQVLGNIDPMAGMTLFLVALEDEDAVCREVAIDSLAFLGESAVPVLLARLRHTSKPVRVAAAETLALIGSEQALSKLRAARRLEMATDVCTALDRAIVACTPFSTHKPMMSMYRGLQRF